MSNVSRSLARFVSREKDEQPASLPACTILSHKQLQENYADANSDGNCTENKRSHDVLLPCKSHSSQNNVYVPPMSPIADDENDKENVTEEKAADKNLKQPSFPSRHANMFSAKSRKTSLRMGWPWKFRHNQPSTSSATESESTLASEDRRPQPRRFKFFLHQNRANRGLSRGEPASYDEQPQLRPDERRASLALSSRLQMRNSNHARVLVLPSRPSFYKVRPALISADMVETRNAINEVNTSSAEATDDDLPTTPVTAGSTTLETYSSDMQRIKYTAKMGSKLPTIKLGLPRKLSEVGEINRNRSVVGGDQERQQSTPVLLESGAASSEMETQYRAESRSELRPFVAVMQKLRRGRDDCISDIESPWGIPIEDSRNKDDEIKPSSRFVVAVRRGRKNDEDCLHKDRSLSAWTAGDKSADDLADLTAQKTQFELMQDDFIDFCTASQSNNRKFGFRVK